MAVISLSSTIGISRARKRGCPAPSGPAAKGFSCAESTRLPPAGLASARAISISPILTNASAMSFAIFGPVMSMMGYMGGYMAFSFPGPCRRVSSEPACYQGGVWKCTASKGFRGRANHGFVSGPTAPPSRGRSGKPCYRSGSSMVRPPTCTIQGCIHQFCN